MPHTRARTYAPPPPTTNTRTWRAAAHAQLIGGPDLDRIIRMQLALMKPGVSDIKIHVDTGGYAINGHRLHIPVFTHPDVSFDVCPHRLRPDPTHIAGPDEPQRMIDVQECFKIPTTEGFVFELNNRVAHRVANPSPISRVHLVVDLTEDRARERVAVPPGTVCDYDMLMGLLCTAPDGSRIAASVPSSAQSSQQESGVWGEGGPTAGGSSSTQAAADAPLVVPQADGSFDAGGYSAADDALAAGPADDGILPVLPPVPMGEALLGAGSGGAAGGGAAGGLVAGAANNHQHGAAVQHTAGAATQQLLLGNVGNAGASTWFTEAMHAGGSGAAAAGSVV